jgi:hypothetical protein
MHINAHYGCPLKIHYKITSDDWCRCKIDIYTGVEELIQPLRTKFYIHNHERWVTPRFTYLGRCYWVLLLVYMGCSVAPRATHVTSLGNVVGLLGRLIVVVYAPFRATHFTGHH